MQAIEGNGRLTCIFCFCLLRIDNIKNAISYTKIKDFATTY